MDSIGWFWRENCSVKSNKKNARHEVSTADSGMIFLVNWDVFLPTKKEYGKLKYPLINNCVKRSEVFKIKISL